MKKQNKDAVKDSKKDYKKLTGMLMLFVIASIAYSSVVVYLGTQGITPKAMLVPQVLFALFVAIKQFTK